MRRQALADVVRRLIELSVTNDAPSDVLIAVTADLERSVDQLTGHVPAVPIPAGSAAGR